MNVSGVIPGLGKSGSLVTGSISQFGYNTNLGDKRTFEFIFNVTGGSLASYFGSTIGVRLDSGVFTAFNPNNPFDNGALAPGIADAFTPVPEPLTATCVFVGCCGVIGYLRQRVRSRPPCPLTG